MMTDWRLRRRCEARLRSLSISVPFDLEQFVAEVAKSRPRPISLVPMSLRGQPYGLWLTDGERDSIWFERETTPTHQRHIILHELCHLLCEHQPRDSVMLDGPFPDLDTARLRVVLQRSGYTREEEREAEMMASMIVERASADRNGEPADAPSIRLLQMLGVRDKG
jgi:hypothetical protein